jgi:hypothetical protein
VSGGLLSVRQYELSLHFDIGGFGLEIAPWKAGAVAVDELQSFRESPAIERSLCALQRERLLAERARIGGQRERRRRRFSRFDRFGGLLDSRFSARARTGW